jgi:hypothetical protein
MRTNLLTRGAAIGAFLAAVASASAWTSEADVGVRVNGHDFHHVRASGGECKVTIRVDFDAPEKGYSDPKNVVRNYHRFQARVKFAHGQVSTSGVMSNTSPGEHSFTFEDDTTAHDCWGKDANKVVKLDVIGCRGKGCDLGHFDD